VRKDLQKLEADGGFMGLMGLMGLILYNKIMLSDQTKLKIKIYSSILLLQIFDYFIKL
jgi:hypothetical protein